MKGRDLPIEVAQIVPPGEGGVRDFAQRLAEPWQRGAVASVIWALSRQEARETPLRTRLSHWRTGQADAPAIPALVLHFSGYGYAERGLCEWLLQQVQDARRVFGPQLRLAVVFHELFARGEPPWRSAFWLAPLQARIVARLALVADVVWTNNEDHARWLRERTAPREVTVQPVFSGLGEPVVPARWEARRPQAVLFGAESTRRRAAAALQRAGNVLAALGIEELIELGPGAPVASAAFGLAHRHLGRLPADAASRVLETARLGLLAYPGALLGKSSVFAAFVAHACPVMNLQVEHAAADGLRPGEHYLGPAGLVPGTDPQAIAASALAWYRRHALALQAARLLALLRAAPRGTGRGLAVAGSV
jgi:hypothetical protein